MHWSIWVLSLLTLCTQNVTGLNRQQKRSDKMFLAMVCDDHCKVRVRFMEELSANNTNVAYELRLVSENGSLHESTIDVPEDINIVEFVFPPNENETVITEIWDLNFSETYFHSTGSLQLVGNLPCGKYGCPQTPLCDGGCRFTVIASLAAFCFSILAGLILQTVYVSFLGFRKTRKELELRDTLRLTEAGEN